VIYTLGQSGLVCRISGTVFRMLGSQIYLVHVTCHSCRMIVVVVAAAAVGGVALALADEGDVVFVVVVVVVCSVCVSKWHPQMMTMPTTKPELVLVERSLTPFVFGNIRNFVQVVKPCPG
jgi:type IV secretory pathway protease TraF